MRRKISCSRRQTRSETAAKATRLLRQRSGEIKLICLINNQIVVKHKNISCSNDKRVIHCWGNKRDMNIVIILSQSLRKAFLFFFNEYSTQGIATWVIFSEISAWFLVSSHDSRWFSFDFYDSDLLPSISSSWRFNHKTMVLKLPPSLGSSFLSFTFIRHSFSLSLTTLRCLSFVAPRMHLQLVRIQYFSFDNFYDCIVWKQIFVNGLESWIEMKKNRK